MFEDCKTMYDLNKERALIVKKHEYPLPVINTAYNAKRKEITALIPAYTHLNKTVCFSAEPVTYNGCMYAGKATEKNTIQITAEGVFV